MITEKSFVSSHRSFWHSTAPLLSQYVKTQNTQLNRFSKPYGQTSSDDRGLIGELAFRLFVAGYEISGGIGELDDGRIRLCVEQSVQFIKRFRAFSRRPGLIITEKGIRESLGLAQCLEQFFSEENTALDVWPKFPGCGWLDSVEGDGVGGSTLYEVKCGQSKIRGKDIKQILCYLALNYMSRSYALKEVCIFNPRTGLVFRSDVEGLCQGIAGVTEPFLMGEIVGYLSEPTWVFEGV